jgi:hypothetical protein
VSIKKQGLSADLNSDFDVYFKNADMDQPKILMQESEEHKDEVAVSLSFVPTFLKPEQANTCEVETDTKPELVESSDYSSKSTFIFLVDRSGSMWGGRIATTVEALKLFLQSLPPGSMFEIISYGSQYKTFGKNEGVEYND